MVKQSNKKKRTSIVKKNMKGGKVLKRKKYNKKSFRTIGSRYPEAHLNLRLNNYLSTKPRAYKLFVCYGMLKNSEFKTNNGNNRDQFYAENGGQDIKKNKTNSVLTANTNNLLAKKIYIGRGKSNSDSKYEQLVVGIKKGNNNGGPGLSLRRLTKEKNITNSRLNIPTLDNNNYKILYELKVRKAALFNKVIRNFFSSLIRCVNTHDKKKIEDYEIGVTYRKMLVDYYNELRIAEGKQDGNNQDIIPILPPPLFIFLRYGNYKIDVSKENDGKCIWGYFIGLGDLSYKLDLNKLSSGNNTLSSKNGNNSASFNDIKKMYTNYIKAFNSTNEAILTLIDFLKKGQLGGSGNQDKNFKNAMIQILNGSGSKININEFNNDNKKNILDNLKKMVRDIYKINKEDRDDLKFNIIEEFKNILTSPQRRSMQTPILTRTPRGRGEPNGIPTTGMSNGRGNRGMSNRRGMSNGRGNRGMSNRSGNTNLEKKINHIGIYIMPVIKKIIQDPIRNFPDINSINDETEKNEIIAEIKAQYNYLKKYAEDNILNIKKEDFDNNTTKYVNIFSDAYKSYPGEIRKYIDDILRKQKENNNASSGNPYKNIDIQIKKIDDEILKVKSELGNPFMGLTPEYITKLEEELKKLENSRNTLLAQRRAISQIGGNQPTIALLKELLEKNAENTIDFSNKITSYLEEFEGQDKKIELIIKEEDDKIKFWSYGKEFGSKRTKKVGLVTCISFKRGSKRTSLTGMMTKNQGGRSVLRMTFGGKGRESSVWDAIRFFSFNGMMLIGKEQALIAPGASLSSGISFKQNISKSFADVKRRFSEPTPDNYRALGERLKRQKRNLGQGARTETRTDNGSGTRTDNGAGRESPTKENEFCKKYECEAGESIQECIIKLFKGKKGKKGNLTLDQSNTVGLNKGQKCPAPRNASGGGLSYHQIKKKLEKMFEKEPKKAQKEIKKLMKMLKK